MDVGDVVVQGDAPAEGAQVTACAGLGLSNTMGPMPTFGVSDVSQWIVHGEEPLGSKEKDWMRPNSTGDLWLFKLRRENSGEDWAEKVAEQLAATIRLPHAKVELATRDGRRGIISRDFRVLPYGSSGRFVPGNELMWRADTSYQKEKRRRLSQYTVERSLNLIAGLDVHPPRSGIGHDETLTAATCFVGYLMFDAWIGNLDRHHENWGAIQHVVQGEHSVLILAPSFDHAASLGHNETDERRERRLATNDSRGTIDVWARSGNRSCFYREGEPKACRPIEAFDTACRAYPEAGQFWLRRLDAVDSEAQERVLSCVPSTLLSSIGRRFTLRLLDIYRQDLLTRLLR